MNIRVGDEVMVITGDDKGVRGKVLSVHRDIDKITVEGVNLAYKHVRRSRRNPQGGRLSKEMPISVSNVQLLDPRSKEPTRVGVRYLPDGSKERFSRKSGAALEGDKVAPARARYAKSAK
jgi:large subunit ribosomal protein L24